MAKKLFICEYFKKHDPPCHYAICEDEKYIVTDAEVHEVDAHLEVQSPVLEAEIRASLLDPPVPNS